ncbi:MAG TPA: glutathione S-transferase [Polyangiaceae bacterium]|jgi:glutathione S-transferase
MRTLYHFQNSPFSRRARLALAHKGLDCALRDGRDDPAALEEARRLVPFRTLPVLIDGTHALADSGAISHWLDRAYPAAPHLWPDGEGSDEAFGAAALVDVVLSNVVDTGTRYYALHEHPAWEKVKTEQVGRAQQAAQSLAERVSSLGRPTMAASGWSAADIWVLTMTIWFEGMPARAAVSPNIAQILTLGFVLPPALSRWVDAHRERPDVRALG